MRALFLVRGGQVQHLQNLLAGGSFDFLVGQGLVDLIDEDAWRRFAHPSRPMEEVRHRRLIDFINSPSPQGLGLSVEELERRAGSPPELSAALAADGPKRPKAAEKAGKRRDKPRQLYRFLFMDESKGWSSFAVPIKSCGRVWVTVDAGPGFDLKISRRDLEQHKHIATPDGYHGRRYNIWSLDSDPPTWEDYQQHRIHLAWTQSNWSHLRSSLREEAEGFRRYQEHQRREAQERARQEQWRSGSAHNGFGSSFAQALSRAVALKELGLPASATKEQIRKAWQRAAVTRHPDNGGSEESFRRAAEARDALIGKRGG